MNDFKGPKDLWNHLYQWKQLKDKIDEEIGKSNIQNLIINKSALTELIFQINDRKSTISRHFIHGQSLERIARIDGVQIRSVKDRIDKAFDNFIKSQQEVIDMSGKEIEMAEEIMKMIEKMHEELKDTRKEIKETLEVLSEGAESVYEITKKNGEILGSVNSKIDRINDKLKKANSL